MLIPKRTHPGQITDRPDAVDQEIEKGEKHHEYPEKEMRDALIGSLKEYERVLAHRSNIRRKSIAFECPDRKGTIATSDLRKTRGDRSRCCPHRLTPGASFRREGKQRKKNYRDDESHQKTCEKSTMFGFPVSHAITTDTDAESTARMDAMMMAEKNGRKNCFNTGGKGKNRY
jgi:hypothetical protein